MRLKQSENQKPAPSTSSLTFLHGRVKNAINNPEFLALHNAITYFNLIGAWGMAETLTSLLRKYIAEDGEPTKDQLLNNAWASREAA